MDLLPNAARGGLDFAHLPFGIWEVRIDQYGNCSSAGPQLTQQSKSLRLDFDKERAYASDVAARAMQAGDKADPDWVGAADEDDWYGCGRRFGRRRGCIAA